MMSIKNLKRFSLIAIIATLTACGGAAKKQTSNDESVSSDEKKKQVESFVEKEFEYPLPTSFEITQMLSDANSGYDDELLSDPEKAGSYVSTWQKATNLGVYGADLSYAATFEEKQEMIDYLEASKKLIDDLNISTAFNQKAAERIEENIENMDSLIYIVSESFYDTYNHLNKNGEEKTSILVVAGSVIEGLHINCGLIEKSANKSELLKVLASQKTHVAKLIELMEKFPEDTNIKRVLPDLKYIKLVYDQIGENTSVSEGQFKDIMNSVKEMRKHITG